jgi:hypothetical protein
MKTILRTLTLVLLVAPGHPAFINVLPAQTNTNQVRINERYPIKGNGELSPPRVWPIHECAQVVFVDGFIPHAVIKVYSGGTQLVGQANNPPFGFTVVPLTRALNLGEKITATQTVLGFTSAHSYYPVVVEPYDPSGLTKPVVGKDIYDCGQVVPVDHLVASAWVNVFDGGQKIGTDETTGTWDPVITSHLVQGHLITAQQVACPDDSAHTLKGPMSSAVRVKPAPNPTPAPSVDPTIIGNDAVTLHGLYVGAEVEVLNHGIVIGGGLATAVDNICPVNSPISAGPSIQVRQTLCTPSALSLPQTKTMPLNAPMILPPVCNRDHEVTIRYTQIDATVVLLRNGSQIVGYGGAVAGDLHLQVAGGIQLNSGDKLTAVQYMGATLGPMSATVIVGNCNDVVTYHNDNARTGLNPHETILGPSTVNPTSFGKLFSQPVDGFVYAQPLYLSQVSFPGIGTHNAVFVVTEHDSVYAFDADSNAGPDANALWHVKFIDSNAGTGTVASPGDVSCEDVHPEIGIEGTPVIDRGTKTLYLVAKTKEATGGHTHFVQRLHALDVSTGAEKFGGPSLIADTICDNAGSSSPIYQYVNGPKVSGIGEGNDGQGNVFLNALRQAQRSGLALVNGVVYVAWASHCDDVPYHGWVVGFDAQTLSPISVISSTPNATSSNVGLAGGGIWQGGAAPAADAQGTLFLATGNGVFDNAVNGIGFPNQADFGDSILKLVGDPGSSAANPNANGWGLKVADFFTPHDQANLEATDADLGSGGVLVLPDQLSRSPSQFPHLLVQAGKTGTIYLVNRDQMGKFHATDDSQIVQSLPGAIGGVWGMPAYYNQAVYYSGQEDELKGFRLSSGKLSATPFAKSTTHFGFPGATPSVSGGVTNGVVWALQTDAYGNGGPTILHAYAADSLKELYNSTMAAGSRDVPPGGTVKFTVPTIVNGKVYVGTSSSVTVFGELYQLRSFIRPPQATTATRKM